MAARVNRRIWPNAFVCLQKVHRLSKPIELEGPKSTAIVPGWPSCNTCVCSLFKIKLEIMNQGAKSHSCYL